MNTKFKIGRNEPCPCGSGKKYKNCCGAGSNTPIRATEQTNVFQLNRTIAYRGTVGRQREQFCLQYIKHKQAKNKEIMSKLIERAESKGETVTCHIGCSFCCVEQVKASLQECEAIVYYLYKHERALRAFLRRYPQWHSEVDRHGAIIEELSQRHNEMVQSKFSEESWQAYSQEGAIYASLNIPCPFLNDSKCLIYEVRPLVCANLVATTPAEWCNPTNPNWGRRRTDLETGVSTSELPFYYEISTHIEAVVMPLAVYGILKGAFRYLSMLTGSDSLEAEVMNDPETKATIQKLL